MKKVYSNYSKYEGESRFSFKTFTRERHGKGMFKYPFGDIYEGEWKHNKMHGKGTLKFFSGLKLEGQWKNSKLFGYGTLFDSDGKECKFEIINYDIHNDCNDFTFSNGDTLMNKLQTVNRNPMDIFTPSKSKLHEDRSDNFRLHGEAILTYPNGDKYEGEWKDGKRHGRGSIISDLVTRGDFAPRFLDTFLFEGRISDLNLE